MLNAIQNVAKQNMEYAKHHHNTIVKIGIQVKNNCLICNKETNGQLTIFDCGHVFHSACLNDASSCPKCNSQQE